MFHIVKSIIDAWDPYSLLAGGAPADEFDSESRRVAALIHKDDSIDEIVAVISDVFSESFFPEDFPKEKCMDVAKALKNRLVCPD